MIYKLDDVRLNWLTSRTKRGRAQELYNLVDGDFEKLKALEKQITNCHLAYSPANKEDVYEIMALVPKSNWWKFPVKTKHTKNELVLLTYDCTVLCVYDSLQSGSVFSKNLNDATLVFAKDVNVPLESVKWMRVDYDTTPKAPFDKSNPSVWNGMYQNWVYGMVVLYTTVSKDWTPRKATVVFDDVLNTDYPMAVTTMESYMMALDAYSVMDKTQTYKSHNLFHSYK